MARLLCAVLIAVIAADVAAARPVSYQGGWTVIEQTDRQSTALWAHYTINPKFSLGYRGEWDRQQDVLFQGVQGTWLAKRWFGENYQANLYAFGGVGAARGVDANPADDWRAAGFGGIAADWETRRWFASYRVRAFEAGAVDATVAQSARVGVAPYVADTGALHTWLMVEIDHRPDNDDSVGVTPLVRVFKGSMLLEAGWSVTDGQPLANFTYRF